MCVYGTYVCILVVALSKSIGAGSVSTEQKKVCLPSPTNIVFLTPFVVLFCFFLLLLLLSSLSVFFLPLFSHLFFFVCLLSYISFSPPCPCLDGCNPGTRTMVAVARGVRSPHLRDGGREAVKRPELSLKLLYSLDLRASARRPPPPLCAR